MESPEKTIIKEFNLTEEDIKNIIENNNYKELNNYNYTNKLRIKYKYQSKTNKFIYYRCSIRNLCDGRGKIDIDKKKFIVTNICNEKVEHNRIDYTEFVELYEKKNMIILILKINKSKSILLYIQ